MNKIETMSNAELLFFGGVIGVFLCLLVIIAVSFREVSPARVFKRRLKAKIAHLDALRELLQAGVDNPERDMALKELEDCRLEIVKAHIRKHLNDWRKDW